MISVRTTLISLFNVCDISLSLINILLWQRFCSSRWAKNVFSLWCTFVRLLLSLILNFFGEKKISTFLESTKWILDIFKYTFFEKNKFQKTWNSCTGDFFIRTHINFVQCLISLNCSESQETLGIATLRFKHVIKNDKKEGWGCCRDSFSFDIVFPDLKLFFFFFLCTIYFYPNPMTVKR